MSCTFIMWNVWRFTWCNRWKHAFSLSFQNCSRNSIWFDSVWFWGDCARCAQNPDSFPSGLFSAHKICMNTKFSINFSEPYNFPLIFVPRWMKLYLVNSHRYKQIYLQCLANLSAVNYWMTCVTNKSICEFYNESNCEYNTHLSKQGRYYYNITWFEWFMLWPKIWTVSFSFKAIAQKENQNLSFI